MRYDPQPEASHHVAGACLEDTAGAPLPVICPATGAQIALLHEATPAVIDRALQAARTAQPGWAALKGVERGRILRRAADLIRDRNRALSELETRDTGKPLQETLVADATSAADALEYFGGLAGSITGDHVQLGADWGYTIREPLGVCVGIGAWNYPTQIAGWKCAPALACGNAMVFKPSETTPLCALKLAEILTEAGLPPGVFNVVQGAGTVGAALVEDPRVAKVSLTGSVPTGRKVYAAAAAGIKSVTMELGGKSPLIVFDDADLENAVGGAILANFYSTGQICSNGTRVFVQRGMRDAFLSRLAERLQGVVMGDPLDESVNFGPMVSERQRGIVLDYIATGLAEGATLVSGGKAAGRPAAGAVDLSTPVSPDRTPDDALRAAQTRDGFFIEPTVFADVTDGMTTAREEIFGPVMAVLDFNEEDEVIARANASEMGLSAGVFTSDLARAHRVIGQLQAGTCYINSYNDAPVELPFGGSKLSGVGRENARAAIEHYSRPKSVFVRMGDVEAPF